MKKLLLLFVTILLLQSNMLAQAPDTLWTKTYGGIGRAEGNSVQLTSDGGYIVAGAKTSVGASDSEVWLIKLAPESPTDFRSYDNQISSNYSISQNYPNPFNPSTTIKYSIPKQSNITLKVFDVLGSEVATLVNKKQPQGNYEVEFDASTSSATGHDLSSGIYFYRLQANDYIETKKMILLR